MHYFKLSHITIISLFSLNLVTLRFIYSHGSVTPNRFTLYFDKIVLNTKRKLPKWTPPYVALR
jgi:hypothetical protein